jgi:hypothetical protein
MSHLAKAWATSITKECWVGFKRSVDHNPTIGMCFVMFVSACAMPFIVPPLRETFGYSTSQFTRTSVPTWRLMKEVQDAKEGVAGGAPAISIESMAEEEE